MPKKQERRNGHAFHPIMSKGGAHGKSKKAQRKAAKHEVKRKVHEWLGRSFFGYWKLDIEARAGCLGYLGQNSGILIITSL